MPKKKSAIAVDGRNVGGKQALTEHLLHHHTRVRNVRSDLAKHFSQSAPPRPSLARGGRGASRRSLAPSRAPPARRGVVGGHPEILLRRGEGYANPLRPGQTYAAGRLLTATFDVGGQVVKGVPAPPPPPQRKKKVAAKKAVTATEGGGDKPKKKNKKKNKSKKGRASASATKRFVARAGATDPGGNGTVVTDPYRRLQDRMFGLVVQHRLFRDDDLEALFDRARELNTHLDPARVEQTIAALRSELGASAHGHGGALGASRLGATEARFAGEGSGVSVSVSVSNVTHHDDGRVTVSERAEGIV